MKFKSKRVEERFETMTETAQKLCTEMCKWAMDFHGIELVITETRTIAAEDHKLGRESDTHRTGRAFDIRTKDLPDWFKTNFKNYFDELYKESLGALTKEGPRLIVDKPHGSGPHWHVQVRRGVK